MEPARAPPSRHPGERPSGLAAVLPLAAGGGAGEADRLCTWLGLPPGSAAVAASDASASLATGQVRVEMSYLYGPREAGPDPMGPRAQPSSGAKADGLRGVLV